jgi:putative ABC transport system ATP-binding protein
MAEKKEELIQLKAVVKTYRMGGETLAVLNGVNLDIKEGEFVAIMGPSGSGKSTLANVIGGLDRPTSGSIRVDGEDLDSLNDRSLSAYRNKKIGFIFQSFNLLPNFTALENVMIPLILAGVSSGDRKKKALDYLKVVGLENRSHHKPTQLSGGERQRVCIARALINDPKIIIADEPTGNLDSKKTTEIISLLKILNQEEKMTLLVITHDPTVAHEAHRILKLYDGKIMRSA